MTTLLLFTLTASTLLRPPVDSQDVATFSSYELGLEFNHPKAWKVSTKKDRTTIQVPVAGSAEPASLEILGVMWQNAPSLWDEVQRQANKQLKREVLKQWQEEILGVPLLLTKVAYEDAGGSKTSLIGLLYNAAPRKLNFRLTSSSDGFENAEFEFRRALQSLRTIKGDMPKAEDPSRPVDPKDYEKPVATKPPKKTVIEPTKSRAQEIRRAEGSAQVRVAERNVQIFFPSGWTFQAAESLNKLVSPGFPSGLEIRTFFVADSDAPSVALQKSAGAALASFEAVTSRREVSARVNQGGCNVASVWREGKSGGAAMSSIDAVGAQGDFYWIVSYRGPTLDPNATAEIEGLLRSMSIELVP